MKGGGGGGGGGGKAMLWTDLVYQETHLQVKGGGGSGGKAMS